MDPKKTIAIKDLDVKSLLGKEKAEAHIASDLPLRKWLYSWLLDRKRSTNPNTSLTRIACQIC